MDFLFTVRFRNPKKDLQNYFEIVNSFDNYACAYKTAVLKDSFSNPFRISYPNGKNRYLSVEIRFRISRSIVNPKSAF